MMFITSRWHSPIQFDDDQDPQLWLALVSGISRIDDSIWKIWTITDVFRSMPSEAYESYLFGIGPDSYSTEIVTKSAPSYLQIEKGPGQTTFTIASVSQSALHNLQALITNLYEPVRPAGLDTYLDPNQDVPIKLVEVINRETGDKVRQSYVDPVNSSLIFSSNGFPLTKWDVLNLSIIPQIDDSLTVVKLQIKPQANQIWFILGEEERFLSHPEDMQARDLFAIADRAFGGMVMPVRA